MTYMVKDFVFGHFLAISADASTLKQPNHVKQLRICSTILPKPKSLPLEGYPKPLQKKALEIPAFFLH
jgi:hypothetical protein